MFAALPYNSLVSFTRWYLIVGILLVALVLTGARIKRLPLTTAMVYLGVGWLLGWLGWIRFDPLASNPWLEHLSEIAVILSLFNAGLKLRAPLGSRLWRLPVAMASLSMTITVALIALAGMAWLDLPLGAAVILGAVLAPTDPVLASDVQVENPRDIDRLRFTLTGEAGLNDGTAFPFIMLGIGLLGLHDLGAGGWRWFAVDVLWAIIGGIACGAMLGYGVGRLVIYLRRVHVEAVGADSFLALGLVAITYGLAVALHTYGFLAVFAAGVALRTVERKLSPKNAPADVKAVAASEEELATHPTHAPAFMAAAVLQFDEQIERVLEIALVLIAGAMLTMVEIPIEAFGLAALLLVVIRPLSTLPVLMLGRIDRTQAALMSWFGIRGIGSLYYLYFTLRADVPQQFAHTLVTTTLCAVGVSIIVHGISVTPLLILYNRRQPARSAGS
jgi:sodium/hydrogen antiporter